MYCTFHRTETVDANEWENIIGKLQLDLMKLGEEKTDEFSVYRYVYKLIELSRPLEKNPAMSFLGMWDPKGMPADARVDYFYRPSYIATAFMMKAALLYPSFMNEKTFRYKEISAREFTFKMFMDTLKACMLGCTGRGFSGAGYDDLIGMIECMQMFAENRAGEFIELYPEVCPEFTKLYKDCLETVRTKSETGTVCNAWGQYYTEAAEKLLKTAGVEVN